MGSGSAAAARLARYVMEPVVEHRLAIGLGLLGSVMAGLNWGLAEFLSTDIWLCLHTTFGDIALSMLLFFTVLRYARA